MIKGHGRGQGKGVKEKAEWVDFTVKPWKRGRETKLSKVDRT